MVLLVTGIVHPPNVMSRLLAVALESIHVRMSAARIERLAKLVAYLRSTRRPRPFSEIREEPGFEAYAGPVAASGERAFERDKADLLRAGIPIVYVEERDEEGAGYLIDESNGGVSLEVSMYERAIFSIVGSVAEADRAFPRRAQLQSALGKLAVLGGDESLVAIDVSVNEADGVQHPLSRDVVECALTQASIEIVYEDGHGQTSTRRVDTWGIFRSNERHFVVGYCHLRKNRRVFAIHRIRELTILERPGGRVTPPAGWTHELSIDSSLEWFVHELRQAEIAIPLAQRSEAELIFGRSLSKISIGESDDHLILTIDYGNTEGLLSKIWGLSTWCTLVGPENLKLEARRRIREAFDSQKGIRHGCA